MNGIPLLDIVAILQCHTIDTTLFPYTFLWQVLSSSENANIFHCSKFSLHKFIFLKFYPWLIIQKFKGPIFTWDCGHSLLWHASCQLILFSILVNTFYILISRHNILGVIWSFPPVSIHISSPPSINLEVCKQLRKEKISSKYNPPFLYTFHAFWWTS